MSGLSINEWKVYCETDQVYRTVWSTEIPTTCPDNVSHTISSSPPPVIIQSISENKVKIIEEADGTTQGIYKFKGYRMDIPAGNVGNVTTAVVTHNYPTTLINGWFISCDDMAGDVINLSVADDTVIGAITSPVYSGNTTLSVTQTVLDNVYKGYFVNITDGTQLNDLGEVIGIDDINSTITVSSAASNNFSPLSPSYIRVTIKVIEDFAIPVDFVRYAFAEKKVGGKYLPAGYPTYVKYKNNSGNAKVFHYNMEYLY